MGKYSNQVKTNEAWLPMIPSQWKLKKIKWSFKERSEKGYLDEPLLVASQNMGVVPKNVYGKRTVEALKDLDKLKLVKVGDYVVSLRSFQGGIEYAYYQGIISPAYTIMRPNLDFCSAYYKFLFKSAPFIKLLTTCVTGIREGQNIDYGKLKNHYIPVPPRAEQDQIVRFLDWKVSEINKLIGIRRKEIQDLEELKAEIINSAILQGIDSNVVMKKTDVYYLPKIPATWKVIKIKRICKVGASISNQLKKHTDQDKVVFLPMENISENGKIDCSIKQPIAKVRTGFSSFAKNDVIVAKITPCFENGKGACLDELESDIGYGTTELFNLRAGNDVLPKYLYYITMTKIFRSLGEGQMTGSAGQKRVPADFIRNFVIGLPSIAIQYKIIDYICLKTSQINRLICTKHKQLEFLKELCSTIISDVVTGKIDVRNIPVPAYEHVDDLTADDGEGNDGETGIPGEED